MIDRKRASLFLGINIIMCLLVTYAREHNRFEKAFSDDIYLAVIISLITSIALFALSMRSPS